jgi:hypothetical protein
MDVCPVCGHRVVYFGDGEDKVRYFDSFKKKEVITSTKVFFRYLKKRDKVKAEAEKL